MSRSQSVICISSDFKGVEFIKRLHENGNIVYLISSANEKDKPWPWDSIEQAFYLERQADDKWDMQHLIDGFGWFIRSHHIDRIIALDDFEVEKAAYLREEYRIPGMGQTTARHFRDKLAMRVKAQDAGIPVPHFSSLFNDQALSDYLSNNEGPYVIKPRSEASAAGIKKVNTSDEVWQHVHTLGDSRPQYLIEEFLPGAVYHVDGMTLDYDLIFTNTSKYLKTPMEVAHGGNVFQSMSLAPKAEDSKALNKLNKKVVKSFGMKDGAFHSEFIRADRDGKYYFLETSSRVGGANLAEMVEASTGINLWTEWGQMESDLLQGKKYKCPKPSFKHAGIVISLSRFEHPDTQDFNDSEIVWRLDKPYHLGFIIASEDESRVRSIMDNYSQRILEHYHAAMPSK